MPLTKREPPAELFYFLGGMLGHMVLCVLLFTGIYFLPTDRLQEVAGKLFDVLSGPGRLPLSSLVWGIAIALLARVMGWWMRRAA